LIYKFQTFQFYFLFLNHDAIKFYEFIYDFKNQTTNNREKNVAHVRHLILKFEN